MKCSSQIKSNIFQISNHKKIKMCTEKIRSKNGQIPLIKYNINKLHRFPSYGWHKYVLI